MRAFDVRDLYDGPATPAESRPDAGTALDEKLRQAYFWIVNYAIITPYYDLEFNDRAPPSFRSKLSTASWRCSSLMKPSERTASRSG